MLSFCEATHTYTVGGRVLPSVTQIIAPIRQDFSTVPPAVLEMKRQIGSAVHKACEFDDAGELDFEGLVPLLQGYVTGWRRFIAHTGAVVIANEQRLYHEALGFAGTLDRLLEVAGELWLVDIKTAAQPHRSYGVQLAGYELLVAGAAWPGRPVKRASAHLTPEGVYRLHPFNDPSDGACFRALLSIHHWKETHQ
jgi:hypothetical protein